jgi:hypothetical protein
MSKYDLQVNEKLKTLFKSKITKMESFKDLIRFKIFKKMVIRSVNFPSRASLTKIINFVMN